MTPARGRQHGGLLRCVPQHDRPAQAQSTLPFLPFPGASSSEILIETAAAGKTRAYMSAVYASTVPYSIVPIEAGAKAVVRAEAETKANAAADALFAEEAAEAVAAATSALCKGKGRSKGKGKSSGKP